MGIDSLWLPELVFGSLVEPFIGMAHALARTSRLKVGTGVAILPGRHPVLVAKQLASLAAVSPGRRAAVFDESLELLRLLLRQESVSFTGQYFTVEGASVGPPPAKPLDIWTGGSAPGALRRTGRLADGWLGSFLTPAEAGAARETIQAAAADAGREIEEDHFGISLAVVTGSGGAGGPGGAGGAGGAGGGGGGWGGGGGGGGWGGVGGAGWGGGVGGGAGGRAGFAGEVGAGAAA